MLNILMTDALVESVNKHIRNKVLPIAPCLPDDDNMRRRPYSSDESRHMSGFNTRGVAYPLKTFGKLPATSNIGIPLFDGRGSVWLIRDGIVVVFEDAGVYYVIKNDELHQWFVSEVHNALLDEYNKITQEVVAAEEAAAPQTITTKTTPVTDTYAQWRAEKQPLTIDTLKKYFDPRQYCEPLLVPTQGKALHYRTQRRLENYILQFATNNSQIEPRSITRDANSHNQHICDVYWMLYQNNFSFIHLATELVAYIHTDPTLVVNDVFLVNTCSCICMLLVSQNDRLNHIRVEIDGEMAAELVSVLKHQEHFIAHEEYIAQWLGTHMA